MQNIKKTILFALIVVFILANGSFAQASEVTGDLSNRVFVQPTVTPAAGTYNTGQNVVLSATDSTSIHYTTDGTDPTCSTGTVYSGPIVVGISKTIKAVSCYTGGGTSPVASFAYVIDLSVNANELQSLLTYGALVPEEGETNSSTHSLTANQEIEIDVPEAGGTGASKVILPVNTIISAVDGSNINGANLTATDAPASSLSGLGTGVVVGAMQWGIANLGLQFSTPITLKIYVGTSYNGQTLNIVRSVSGSSDWTNEGIEAPATCVVTDGFCVFQATKASYYAVTSPAPTSSPTPSPTPAPAPSSGGGGGGGGGSSVVTPSGVSISINSGAASTATRNVQLTLSATNATMMAIANEPTFTGTSFEAFVTTKDWTLSEGVGDKTVYVRFRSSSGGTVDVSDSINLTLSALTPLSPAITGSLPTGQVKGVQTFADGALIRAIGDFDVYIVKYVPSTGSGQTAKQFKRLILSPSVFNSYQHLKWGDVLDVEKSVVDSFITSELVRAVNDTRVYKLYPAGDTGEKRWVKTAEGFTRMSFDWDAIYEINATDRNSYVTGVNIE